MRIDAVAQNWRRRMHKRELGRRALAALGLEIDLAQLDVLFAIAAPDYEFATNAEAETMVSTVAERLMIDPSRASRLVAEMVNLEYARRIASQRDARRTILELTPAGEAIVTAVRNYKWLLLGEFFSGWSDDDLEKFVPMLESYSDWMRTSESSEEKFAGEIAEMAQQIRHIRQEPAAADSR
ncbi:MarR family transcriptional regulator [Pelagibacterium lacus]|uniref:MarR family transcriptional regulator n=2 Tax=Pelagibacterium lacus TaxID=2282655 RepID=A0A369W986_9HYPH|nr:MarR family transcriptional regulator [Pelagibacterium lacus]